MSKIERFLAGIAALLVVLVGIKASLVQLLPANFENVVNSWYARGYALFNADCDLEGKWICKGGGGCEGGKASIATLDGGFLLKNEKGQFATAIPVKPRILFIPAWDASKGGMLLRASADCRRLDPVESNGTHWERQ